MLILNCRHTRISIGPLIEMTANQLVLTADQLVLAAFTWAPTWFLRVASNNLQWLEAIQKLNIKPLQMPPQNSLGSNQYSMNLVCHRSIAQFYGVIILALPISHPILSFMQEPNTSKLIPFCSRSSLQQRTHGSIYLKQRKVSRCT